MAGKHEERHLIKPAKGELQARSATPEDDKSADQTENNLQNKMRRGTITFLKNVLVQRLNMQANNKNSEIDR